MGVFGRGGSNGILRAYGRRVAPLTFFSLTRRRVVPFTELRKDTRRVHVVPSTNAKKTRRRKCLTYARAYNVGIQRIQLNTMNSSQTMLTRPSAWNLCYAWMTTTASLPRASPVAFLAMLCDCEI